MHACTSECESTPACARAQTCPYTRAPAGQDVSPLCLVSVNVSMASQAWSCDRSADEPLLPHPLPPPLTLPAFSTGIKYPLLSGHHLWHVGFLFKFRSEPARHWCPGYDASQRHKMPSGHCWGDQENQGDSVVHRTGWKLVSQQQSAALTCVMNQCNSTYCMWLVWMQNGYVWLEKQVTCAAPVVPCSKNLHEADLCITQLCAKHHVLSKPRGFVGETM